MLVLGYIWLPFVALPIFVSLENLDRRLLEAATDLGASRVQAFIRVTLPLAAPGVFAAFLFVFIPTLGEFVTPSLVGGTDGYMYGNQIADLFGTGFPDWRTGSVLALFLLGVVGRAHRSSSRASSSHDRWRPTDGRRPLETGAWLLRAFFALIIVFLYAPIVVLLIFSFNDSDLPTFPLSGFTLRWYHQFLTNPDLQDALRTSADRWRHFRVSALSCSVCSPSIALVRHPFRGRGLFRRLLLSPLVIPFIVFGISLLLLFHAVGVDLGVKTVVIGHVVITLPYAMLVMIPRLQQIDASLEQAAYDLGASRFRTFRSITLPLMLPAVISAYLIAFTTSFDEYAVASFVKGSTVTFPVYLYAALRFPNQLPQVIAVAVVVIGVSLIIVVAAEVGRRVAERRLGSPETG